MLETNAVTQKIASREYGQKARLKIQQNKLYNIKQHRWGLKY